MIAALTLDNGAVSEKKEKEKRKKEREKKDNVEKSQIDSVIAQLAGRNVDRRGNRWLELYASNEIYSRYETSRRAKSINCNFNYWLWYAYMLDTYACCITTLH